MLSAIATGISTMTRVGNCREIQFICLSYPGPLSACHVEARCRQPTDTINELPEEARDVCLHGDIEVWRSIPLPAPVRHGLAGRIHTAQLDLYADCLGSDERAV